MKWFEEILYVQSNRKRKGKELKCSDFNHAPLTFSVELYFPLF